MHTYAHKPCAECIPLRVVGGGGGSGGTVSEMIQRV